MKTITTHYAKMHLSRLLKEAQQGEEIVILKGRVPAARLTALTRNTHRRPAVGTITSAPVRCTADAFEPMYEMTLKEWGL